MKVEKGQKAPAFSLYDSEKNKVNLADWQGKKVVLLFFPQAFTSVCTAELCSIRDDISRFNNLNAQVAGISVDSVFTLAKFKEEQKLNFPLLSDFNKEVSSAYNALYELFAFDMKGVSKRAAFVIDSQGVIQYEEVLEKASDMPNLEAVKATLEKIS